MFIHPAHISKALVQNIRIKSFSSRYKSNSKVQHRTYHQSPHDRIYPSDLDKIRCKYICRDRAATLLHTAACLVPFFQNRPPTRGQKNVHSSPPNANILSMKIISGGLIVRTITTTPSNIVSIVLTSLTFLSYFSFSPDHHPPRNSSTDPSL